MAIVGDVVPFSSVRSQCQNLQQLASQNHGSSSAQSTCQQRLVAGLRNDALMCLEQFESFHYTALSSTVTVTGTVTVSHWHSRGAFIDCGANLWAWQTDRLGGKRKRNAAN